MTRKLLLLSLLVFGCASTYNAGQVTPKAGQSLFAKPPETVTNAAPNLHLPEATLPINRRQVAVISGSVNLRVAPNMDAAVIAVLHTGQQVTVIETGTWLFVDANGVYGYVWAGCVVGYDGGCR